MEGGSSAVCKISLKGKSFRDYSSDHSSDHSSLFVVQISKIYHDFYAFCAIVDDGLDSLMRGPFFSSIWRFCEAVSRQCMLCPKMRWRRCANRYCLDRYILCADGCCRRRHPHLLRNYSCCTVYFSPHSCYCCTTVVLLYSLLFVTLTYTASLSL